MFKRRQESSETQREHKWVGREVGEIWEESGDENNKNTFYEIFKD